MRLLIGFSLMMLSVLSFRGFAGAASSSGAVTIFVTDSAKKPVESARVVLHGSVTIEKVSGKTGRVDFSGLPPGRFALHVIAKGYSTAGALSVRVNARKTTILSVVVSQEQPLKIIAQVQSEPSLIPLIVTVDPNSTERKLADSLFDALGDISGVSFPGRHLTTGASQALSLDGHDPSQVQVSLDGFPVNAPGIAANLRAIDPDLFTSAIANPIALPTAPGGSVNLRSAAPTPNWLTKLTLGVASTGFNYGANVTGTHGKLGVVIDLSHRATSSLIDGLLYADASGLYYAHNGDSLTNGQLVKFDYQLDKAQKLEAEFMNSATTTQTSCLIISGGIPCGYGPGNLNTASLQQIALRDTASIGGVSLTGMYSFNETGDFNDMLARYIAGVPAPFGCSSFGQNRSYSLEAKMPLTNSQMLTLGLNGGAYAGTISGFITAGRPYFSSPQNSSYSTLQAHDTLQATKQLQVTGSFSSNASSGVPHSVSASAGLSWKPTKVDSYAANFQVNGSTPQVAIAVPLTPPASLQFDCNGGLAYGAAPGDTPQANASTDTVVSYAHSWRNVQMAVQGYRQVQSGVLLPEEVNGSALASLGQLSPAYIGAAQNAFYSAAGCSADPSVPFGAQNLYFTTTVGDVQYVYEGAAIKGTVTMHGLKVTPAYNVSVAKAVSNDIRLDNPLSTLIPNAQVPNVPLQTASLGLDYKTPHAPLEYLANVHYTAINNGNNLPAYTTLDVGITAHLAHGVASFGATNVTNTFGGIFASPDNAVPIQTFGGTYVSTIATPLQPRAFFLNYTTQVDLRHCCSG